MFDILQLEEYCQIKLLPDLARDYENIKVFTQEERDADYIDNIKYNKKEGRERLAIIQNRKNNQMKVGKKRYGE